MSQFIATFFTRLNNFYFTTIERFVLLLLFTNLPTYLLSNRLTGSSLPESVQSQRDDTMIALHECGLLLFVKSSISSIGCRH